MFHRRTARAVWLTALVCGVACAGWSAPVLVPTYPDFNLVDLGSVRGVPANYLYGGLGFKGSNLLLSGGDGIAQDQVIYSVPVKRSASGTITGLGTATTYASVPAADAAVGNILAGGLVFAPNGTLLYTTLSKSYIGQYSAGTTTSSLTFVGNVPLGGLGYLPNGQLVLTSTDGNWYPVTLSTPNAQGIYKVTVGAPYLLNVPAGQSGVPADSFASFPVGVSGEVTNASVLVGDSNAQQLALYGLDANGNPTGAVSQIVNGNGDPIGYGVVRDPYHPSTYLFTTGNNEIWALTPGLGVPEPSAGVLGAGGILLLLARLRKR